MQKMPTSRSLTARLRMNLLVALLMCWFLSTMKPTRTLPTMQGRKMSPEVTVSMAAPGEECWQ